MSEANFLEKYKVHMPSANKLPEPVLTRIYVTVRHQ